MPNKKTDTAFRIISWWISWWRDDRDHYFCAIAEINGEMKYIERPLEET